MIPHMMNYSNKAGGLARQPAFSCPIFLAIHKAENMLYYKSNNTVFHTLEAKPQAGHSGSAMPFFEIFAVGEISQMLVGARPQSPEHRYAMAARSSGTLNKKRDPIRLH